MCQLLTAYWPLHDVLSFVSREVFTSFLAQTEEAQDFQYDHDDADDVENVHCRRFLVKSYDKSAQFASKFLHRHRDLLSLRSARREPVEVSARPQGIIRPEAGPSTG